MPEGHTVHRTAQQFEKTFAGQPVFVDSPQGRFSGSASQVSGRSLVATQAIGKQLFLEFPNQVTLRIHLGIYGKWTWHTGEEKVAKLLAAEPIGQVRARFWSATNLAELRGPTVCELMTADERELVAKRLGPDPLNPDPTGSQRDRFVKSVAKSKKAIGLLLMDQSVIAGVGNVYRAELLFRAGLDPYTPGAAVPREVIETLWDDAVKLLRVGVATGVMITRDELFKRRPTKAERNWVYKREGLPCRNCGVDIALALAAGRKLYWCPSCQV